MIEINTPYIDTRTYYEDGSLKSIKSGYRVRKIPITKIRCEYSGISHYYGLVFEPEKNAPDNTEWPEGETWVLFRKNANKHIKIPTLKNREVLDV